MTRIIDLRVDAAEHPLAVDPSAPRLTWAYASDARNVEQLGARVVVAECGIDGSVVSDVWDSGDIPGPDSAVVVPAGVLRPGADYRWTVEAVATDEPSTTLTASDRFETEPPASIWGSSRWITRRRDDYQHDDHRPVPYLRSRIVPRGPVQKARLHATAGGVYKAWVGGEPLGRSALAPGWTDYRHRVPFHTYDVTEQFATGRPVVVGAVVADGWYSGGVGPFHRREFWGKRPVWRAVIVVDYADGGSEAFGTDASWEARFGAIRSADLLQGQVVDLREDLGAWYAADAQVGDWELATEEPGPSGRLVPARIAPPAPVAELAPIALSEPVPGSYVVDFGQNFAGHVRLEVPAAPGSIVRLRHAEVLDNGRVYLANLRGARATDTVVLSDAPAVFEPEFTLHGFRYLEITGYPGRPALDAITGIAISSVSEEAGSVDTGHPGLDRLMSNISWSLRSNFIEVPTDCPSRDERMGWTGDAQIFAPTATYLADVERFFDKWLDDILDTALEDGALPDVAPNGGVFDWTDTGSSGYAEAGLVVPWVVYERYGDTRALERAYEAGARWVDYVRRRTDDLIWRRDRNTDYGDWLSPLETPKDLTATAYFARSAELMGRFAEVLGRHEDASRYRELHRDIAASFRRAFVADDGTMAAGTQTAYTLALRFGLLTSGQRPRALAELAADVDRRGTPTAGFLAISHLLPVLTDEGRGDLALRLLLGEEYPSWLYQVGLGATTTWERWDGWRPETGFQDPLMNSFNHFALGSIGEWVFASLGGIAPAAPGYRRVRIAPLIEPEIGRTSAWYRSPHGEIAVAWECLGDTVVLDVGVPANTRAEIEVPLVDVQEAGAPIQEIDGVTIDAADSSSTRFEVGSGRYRFSGILR